MSRRYADPVAVRLVPTGCDEDVVRPVGFRWRGRSYTVTAVLARWVEADAWWRGAVPAGLGPGSTTASRQPSGAEQVLWRVEAGRGNRIGVYDLCCRRATEPVEGPPPRAGPVADRWFLVRTLD